jgi:hypothetical protein
MDATTFDEGTFVSRDEVGEVWSKAVGHSLGEKLPKAMNEANWAVVRKGYWDGFFGNQGKEGVI